MGGVGEEGRWKEGQESERGGGEVEEEERRGRGGRGRGGGGVAAYIPLQRTPL